MDKVSTNAADNTYIVLHSVYRVFPPDNTRQNFSSLGIASDWTEVLAVSETLSKSRSGHESMARWWKLYRWITPRMVGAAQQTMHWMLCVIGRSFEKRPCFGELLAPTWTASGEAILFSWNCSTSRAGVFISNSGHEILNDRQVMRLCRNQLLTNAFWLCCSLLLLEDLSTRRGIKACFILEIGFLRFSLVNTQV